MRKAYEERYAKMMNENEAKKLTKEQKHDKIRRKFERDIKKECRACLFKIDDLSNKRIKFKIDKNASQLFLTGICIYINKAFGMNLPNLLLVEGGPLAIKKYKTLMLKRIKWDKKVITYFYLKQDKDAEEENLNSENNDKEFLKNNTRCSLVWEVLILLIKGVLKKRYFEKWKIVEIRTENEARKLLSDKGIEHFWNLILSYKDETELKL